ncbi:MAG: hypothetical protein FWH18_12275 [Marinilabiliaceae bacterium]|nr:hypothetical protein [Marinilabiliaceae bacterium]
MILFSLDSSFHFVPFGMTIHYKGNGVQKGAVSPHPFEHPNLQADTVIPNEVRNLD